MSAVASYATVSVFVAVVAAIRGVWSPCGLSMISAINPFSEHSRGNRYWLTAAWFVVGSILGGALLGGMGALGAWTLTPLTDHPEAMVALASVCCLIAVASDTAALPFRLPLHPRQVNELWLGRYRRWVYASGFGAQIGVGLATYIMTAAVYLVPVLGALSGSPPFALLTGLLFGLVRGLAVLLSSGAGDPQALLRLHRRLDWLAPWSLRAAIGIQILAALALSHLAAGGLGLLGVATVVAAGAGVTRRTRTRTRTGAGNEMAGRSAYPR